MCISAEGAAAVRDYLAVGRQLGKTALELIEGDGARPFDVAGSELFGGAHVNEHDVAAAEAVDQLLAADRFDLFAEVVSRRPLDLRQAGRR